MRQILGTYGTIDYAEVVATARGFNQLQGAIQSWSRRWRKKALKRLSRDDNLRQVPGGVNAPRMFSLLKEYLAEHFRALDPECTGQLRVKTFRRLMVQIGLDVAGKAWDAFMSLIAGAASGQQYLVHCADAVDVLTASVNIMVSGRRKVRLALSRFRHHEGSLDRIFPHGTAISVSEVAARLGLSVQTVSPLEEGAIRGGLNERQLQKIGSRPRSGESRLADKYRPQHVVSVPGSDSDNSGDEGRRLDSYAGLNLDAQFQQLQQMKLLRARRKRAVAESLLQKSNTIQQFIYPVLGETCFFEFTLTNAFSSPETVFIDIDDPLKQGNLQLVTNAEEWYAHRRLHDRRFRRRYDGRVEDDMFGSNRETQLGPHESIQIPFKYCWIQDPDTVLNKSSSMAAKRVVTVCFRSIQHQAELARLEVNVIPQGAVLNRTIRLYPQENDLTRTCLRIAKVLRNGCFADNTNSDSQPLDFSVVCSSPDVVVEDRSSTRRVASDTVHQATSLSPHQDIFVRFRCRRFPAVKSFFIVVYADKHQSQLFGVFRIFLHSSYRLGITATLGADVKMELVCRPSRWPRHGRHRSYEYCRLHSSHHDEVSFAPKGEFKMDVLSPASTVLLKYRPQAISPQGSENILATLVNRDLGQVLALWNLSATVAAPSVTEEYTINVCFAGDLLIVGMTFTFVLVFGIFLTAALAFHKWYRPRSIRKLQTPH